MPIQSALTVAAIAAGATCLAACISAVVALMVAKRTSFVEDRTVKIIVFLMRQGNRPYRTFDLIRRRIGGFSDDDLRKVLVRAGAVRFYQRFDKVCLSPLTEAELAQIPEEKRAQPVEIWALLHQPLRGWSANLATQVFYAARDDRGQPADAFYPELQLPGYLHEPEGSSGRL